MRKIWYLAFGILAILILVGGVSIISDVTTTKDSSVVGAYTYSTWIVQLAFNGDGIIYNKSGDTSSSSSERFTWTKDGNNIIRFTGANSHGAFMQRYLFQDGCLVGENGDITLVPYK